MPKVAAGAWPTIAFEIKEELKQSIQTRIEMLKQEMKEKLARLKIVGPLGAAVLLLLGTAYLLITSARSCDISDFCSQPLPAFRVYHCRFRVGSPGWSGCVFCEA